MSESETITIHLILEEIRRAQLKFPTWPTDPLHALAILSEEVGELSKEVVQLAYEPWKTTMDSLQSEATQVAAMAIRFAMSIHQYEFDRCPQHEQRRIGD